MSFSPLIAADFGTVVAVVLAVLCLGYALLHGVGIVVSTVYAVPLIWRDWRKAMNRFTSPVVGTVVGHFEDRSGPQVKFHPEVRYEDFKGRQHLHRSPESRADASPPVGTQVEIAFKVYKPKQAKVTSWQYIPEPPPKRRYLP